MSRSKTRENAFKLVFEHLLRDDDINELYEIADGEIINHISKGEKSREGEGIT